MKLASFAFEGMNTLIVLDDCAASKDVKGRTGELVKVVDYVKEFFGLDEHSRVCFFCHENLVCCVGQQFGEMFFDQVEVIAAAVKSEHRHLIAPFDELLTLF